MTPWLSILIPVYNVEQYLAECLNSVLSQLDESVELLVLDDQSTDKSFSILKHIAATNDNKIKILQHEKNSGLSAARNTLLEAAKGEYLWFLDSDDALAPSAITQLRNIVNNYTPDLILCDYEIWRDTPRRNLKKRKRDEHVHSFSGEKNQLLHCSDQLFKGLYTRGKLHTWSKISKRTLWQEELRFPHGKYFEDMATTHRIAFLANSYFYCPEVWVKYRQRSGSILSTPTLKKIDHMFDALSDVLPLWSNHTPPLTDSARISFICFCITHYWSALKDVKKISVDYSAQKTHYQNRLMQITQLSRREMILTLLAHGKLRRLLRFLR